MMLRVTKTRIRKCLAALAVTSVLLGLVVAGACASEPVGPSSSDFVLVGTASDSQKETIAAYTPPVPEATASAVGAATPRATSIAAPIGTAVAGPTVTANSTTTAASPTAVVPTATVPSATATGTPKPVETQAPLKELGLERVFSWYAPKLPTHMEQTPGGSGRIFVAEQDGRLVEIIGGPGDSSGSTRVVLDITGKTLRRNTEEGLLGFALHPDFSQNGRVVVYYSADNPRRSVISEFTFNANGTVDPGSERIVLQVAQPFGNHNGGMLAFGPDGFLYIALGDGGSGGDPRGNGQDLSTLLGSILRIDVDSGGALYAVPSDNPFVGITAANGDPARGEIWAYGLRNPWRMTFDRSTGELWAADVGQNEIEEVDLIVRGGNYGWNIREGNDCYQPTSGCDDVAPSDLIAPVATYSHAAGCSVTGGYVYDGERLPSLRGSYIYGDFCSGSVWALRRDEDGLARPVQIVNSGHLIPAFGQTADGEVYVLTYSPGIFRFVEK